MSDGPVYRRGDVLWRRTYDRVLILMPASGEVLTLQATACEMWAALEDPGSLDEVSRRLAAVYDAPLEQIASDVAPVLEELERRGALTVAVSRRD
jgi:hypothetical protein